MASGTSTVSRLGAARGLSGEVYPKHIILQGCRTYTHTRTTIGFSVDLTLTDGACAFWTDAQWTEHADLRTAVPTAIGKLANYKNAGAKETEWGENMAVTHSARMRNL